MFHLAVFASNNNGLGTWKRIGSLHREIAIFKRFAQDGWNISLYTYDRSRKLPDIGFAAKVHSQWPFLVPKKLGFLYRHLLPFLFFRQGRKADIIITNQAHSSGTAILAGSLWAAKVIARCGYVYGESAQTLGKSGRRVRKRILQEKTTFEKAYRCIVPTKKLCQWVCENYGLPKEKIVVIPNYVDTEQFKPDTNAKKDFDILCIARLVAKKRHRLLFDALSGTQLKIHLIGNGRLKDKLKSLAKEKSLQVNITERVENSLLPQHINNSKIYVNLAQWEGHPKTLIEAMACGCACIGAKSPGIENLILDGKTGVLVEPEPQQIRNAIELLLKNKRLRLQLGENARSYAVEQFSLDKTFEQYKKVFREALME